MTSTVIRRISAAMDGQPRQQNWPPSLPQLHQTRAPQQATIRGIASSQRSTDREAAMKKRLARGRGQEWNKNIRHNQLNKRRSGGIAPSQQHGRRDREGDTIQSTQAKQTSIEGSAQTKILAMQRLGRNTKGTTTAARTSTEFKGCRRHSSKGDS